jgi:HAD superfamily hydrolase (TIGR01509 family)
MSASIDQARTEDPPFDWDGIKLVVFDVDGTLYRQRPLRIRMAAKLLWHTVTRLDSKTIPRLRYYRRVREEIGELEVADFEAHLRARTCKQFGMSVDELERIVTRWIEKEPLSVLRRYVYPGLERLLPAIRQSGRTVGILSDYAAREKLAALGLVADRIVVAADVGMLKPHPRGLENLMAASGATGSQTVLIGDRIDRDGAAAYRAGARSLILSQGPIDGWVTFRGYDDPIFAPFLTPHSRTVRHRYDR